MKIVDDHEVSESEKMTRFIFGAVFGFILSLLLVFRFGLYPSGALATLIVLTPGAGFLALIHGDRFWITIFGKGSGLC